MESIKVADVRQEDGSIDLGDGFFLEVKAYCYFNPTNDTMEFTAYTHAPGEHFRVRADWEIPYASWPDYEFSEFIRDLSSGLFQMIDYSYERNSMYTENRVDE